MPKAPVRRSNGSSIEVAGVLGGGAAKVKKKIRDIERLLKKDKLPADVRNENQRALKALKLDLESTQTQLRAQKIAKKYHMVRFFEKKKAIRKLKQAKKQYDEAVESDVKKDIKKARKVVRHCEVDVAYIILFPKTEKYISLYPNSEPEDSANPKVKKGIQEAEEVRRTFKKEVEGLIENDELPFSLDDAVAGKTIYVDENRNIKDQREIDAPEEANEDDNEDDFFE